MMKDEITKTTAEAIVGLSTKATYGGAGVAVIGGLTANELAAYAGIIIGIVSLVVATYYKHKHYKLELRKYEDSKRG